MGVQSIWQMLREEQLIVQVLGSDGEAGQHSVAAQVAALRQTVATICKEGVYTEQTPRVLLRMPML